MPDLPPRKVGLISCSGEEMPEGTISRLATRKVMETLQKGRTATICLPLFMAGGEGDRAFARAYPTIAIDGCEKHCAARGTERYSGKPAAGIVVSSLSSHSREELGTARRLSNKGREMVEVTAALAGEMVDRLLEPLSIQEDQAEEQSSPAAGCGSAFCREKK